MKDYLKRALPNWLQHAIYRFLWNPARGLHWRRLKLTCQLPSGLRVEVANRSDWEIYNEVLVNGEYDVPINFALDQRTVGECFRVVDLGANVGYFTFRCADRFFRRYSDREHLCITLIEGSPAVFTDLQRRVRGEPTLLPLVTLRHGLVGRREGEAYLSGSHIHYGNGIVIEPTLGATLVPFIDLAAEFAAWPQIDLLKCDIEGAECDFIQNYPELLRKVRCGVFEFHLYGGDIDQCRLLLQSYGLSRHSVLRETPTFAVEFYWRDEGNRSSQNGTIGCG
jgi:FkbM family methyltransferase